VTAIVEGLGVHVPPRVVTNQELSRRLDTSDEWIRTRTGIAERRFADPGTSTADLATEAGSRALKSAGGGDVDAVIVATMTPDRICPATAPEVAARLGLPHVAAFDVSAVCTGFVYALANATGLIAAGIAGRVLVIGAEVMSAVLDPHDRSTSVIFADGAGALVLRAGDADEPGAVGPFDLGSDGEGADLIQIPAGGSRLPTGRDQPARDQHYFKMDGREVYRHAIPRMVASSRKVLAKAGLEVADVDRLVGHQANARILNAVGERLGVPPERCTVNIDRYGNTSGATIPLALADAGLTTGDRVLITAFGGGLTWGSALLTWPELASI
jgi:3-oxoacyl-[acyl-carrier-protein] synthase-3